MGQSQSCNDKDCHVSSVQSPVHLAIIIPTLNEAGNIGATIHSTRQGKHTPSEVIVVDGGSSDDTVAVAKSWGAQVLRSAPGRGKQMNVGWAASKSEWCLFLHGDSRLLPGYHTLIQQALESESRRQLSAGTKPQWGCFRSIETDVRDACARALLTSGVGLRTRLLHRPYGDQGIFIKRSTLVRLDGFKEWPLLEDVEMVARLGKFSPPAIVDACVFTSGRRWDHLGFWQTTLLNQIILTGYALGMDAHTLAGWYSTQKRPLPQTVLEVKGKKDINAQGGNGKQ